MQKYKRMKKYVASVMLTIFVIFAVSYIVVYHGTRITEVYDRDREAGVANFTTLPLPAGQEIRQHFYAETYSLKGINYILLGVDENTTGELLLQVQTLEGKVLSRKRLLLCEIEPGQWENTELPTHLTQGKEYVLTVENLSADAEPYMLAGEKSDISPAEGSLYVGDDLQENGLHLGFGFRNEYSRTGKILLCLTCVLLWFFGMYQIWLRDRQNSIFHVRERLPQIWSQKGLNPHRKYYYDFLRIIAIWMVIYNHTVLNGYMLFTQEQGTFIFWVEEFFSIFIKVAVPLFWMMTGALLLAREENLRTLFHKRIFRFLLVLIVFTFLQYIYMQKMGKMEDSVNYFRWVYEYCDGVPAYWYLYAYLGYLFMLPLLRKIARGLSKIEFQYVFVGYTIFTGLLPMFEFFLLKEQYHLREDFQIPLLTTSCIVFALMGYYIEYVKKEEEYSARKLLVWIALSFLCILLTAIATNYRCRLYHKWSEIFTQYFFDCFIIVPAYTVFYAVKLWSMHHEVLPAIKRLGEVAGSATFGVMLLENIIRHKMNFVYDMLTPHFGKFMGGILWVSSITLVGIVIVSILRKIPGVKSLI